MDAFSYTANVKMMMSTGAFTVLKDQYPGVTDLSIASREFIDYNECVTSCRTFMDDVKTKINDVAKIVYIVQSEINPAFSDGKPTLSKDWDPHEVSRLWIFDQKMEGTNQISAIGQARVFKIDRPTSVHLSS